MCNELVVEMCQNNVTKGSVEYWKFTFSFRNGHDEGRTILINADLALQEEDLPDEVQRSILHELYCYVVECNGLMLAPDGAVGTVCTECGSLIIGYRDETSVREGEIMGWCQKCQDKFFTKGD
jgi:predicted SprT family Zn-dependent metalloprotease